MLTGGILPVARQGGGGYWNCTPLLGLKPIRLQFYSRPHYLSIGRLSDGEIQQSRLAVQTVWCDDRLEPPARTHLGKKYSTSNVNFSSALFSKALTKVCDSMNRVRCVVAGSPPWQSLLWKPEQTTFTPILSGIQGFSV